MFFSQVARLVDGGATVSINVCGAADGMLSVVILPKPKSGEVALMQPLSVRATPNELDEKLGEAMGDYVGSYATLEQQVAARVAVIEAAADQEKKRTAECVKKSSAKSVGHETASGAKDKGGDPGAKVDSKPEAEASTAGGQKPEQAGSDIQLF